MQTGLTVELPQGNLCLLADRAAFLPKEGLLLVADVHLGKSQAFRKLGVPVPAGTTGNSLERLSRLIQSTVPKELVFLGDMLHAAQGRVDEMLDEVACWREFHSDLPMRLVRGNHDLRAGDPPARWRMEVVNEPWPVGAWALCHHPQQSDGAYVLAGHTHPCAAVGRGRHRLRLPCFHLAQRVGILPAFGGFTGMHRVNAKPGDRVAVVVADSVRWLS